MISVFDTNTYAWVKRDFEEDKLTEVLLDEYYKPIVGDELWEDVLDDVREACEGHNEDYLGYITLDCIDGEEELPYWLSDGLRKAIWEEM